MVFLVTNPAEDFDLGIIFQNVKDFLDSFFNTYMSSDFIGLIRYLFNCIPLILRQFMFLCVAVVIFMGIVRFVRNGD